jgi:hypothetical protein
VDTGTAVRVQTSKWGDRPHWTYVGRYLGEDEHGEWLGFPAGTAFSRPGMDHASPNDQVVLVPTPVAGERPWWLACFHAPGGRAWALLGDSPVWMYADIATPAAWSGDVLHAVDLDLDVVRGFSGRVVVDDEDEFAEHRVRFGYPDEVVVAAEEACRALRAAAVERNAPFDESTPQGWLGLLRDLSG